MEIIVKNLQNRIKLNPPTIIKIVKTVLRHEGVKKASLTIVFVTHQKIRALNKKFLNRDYSTDVLAFGLGVDKNLRKKNLLDRLTGDVIVSTDKAVKNILSFHSSVDKEIALYVIHGVLHLCGYDDLGKKNVKKMRLQEQMYLELLKKDVKGVLS